MNKTSQHSDEHISAYIDNELDSNDCAQLLFDEQTDNILEQRINDARILKEKVKLAYIDFDKPTKKNPFDCTEFVSRHRTLVASLLLIITVTVFMAFNNTNDNDVALAKQLIQKTQAIPAQSISNAVGTNQLVVINISQYNPETFSLVVDNIEALLLQHKDNKAFNIEIVANKTGLKALDTESSLHADRISSLAKKFDSLEVVACAASLARLATKGDPIRLMKSILVTPSAAQQVAKRTNQGWIYLKI